MDYREIDKIVIQILRQLGTDEFGLNADNDELSTLSQFTPEHTVEGISMFLRSIDAEKFVDLPRKLPPGMAQRYAVTQKLAEAIKEVGFRGDVGYQTLLYANSIEVRRIFMFLVEKLPKDSEKSTENDQPQDAISQKEREIITNLVSQLKSPWVPAYARKSTYSKFQYPLPKFQPKTLQMAFVAQREVTDEIKEYWKKYMPSIEEQTTKENREASIIHTKDKFEVAGGIVSSLSFDSLRLAESSLSKSSSGLSLKSSNNASVVACNVETKRLTELIKNNETAVGTTNELDALNAVVEQLKTDIESEILNVQEITSAVCEIEGHIEEEMKEIKSIEMEKRTEDRLEILLQDPENSMEKLEERIQGSHGKMEKLKQQWEAHRQPVLEELEQAKEKYNEKDVSTQILISKFPCFCKILHFKE